MPLTKLLASNFRTQTTIEPIRPVLRFVLPTIPKVFLITATPLNLHKRFLPGGFLQTAVSDAPRTPPEIFLPLTSGRIRYSTSVSGQIPCNHTLTETDFRTELTKVAVPTLIVHGSKDVSAQIDFTGRRTQKLIPCSQLKVYEGAAHGLFITHGERLNMDLLEFISS